MTTTKTAIAVRRFGLGARPGELERVTDPHAWLADRLDEPARFALDQPGLPTVRDAAKAIATFDEMRKDAAAAPEPTAEAQPKPGAVLAEVVLPDLEARIGRALRTDDGFAERLVWFWSNHFTVAASKAQCAPFVGTFERDVVRAHLAGRFEDLLLASTKHPAMLLYLDQARSVGPDSPLGRSRKLGLNENLGREILELHTLGVDGGYGQPDVIELARALTGFTVMRPGLERRFPSAEPGDFVFLPQMHEPGARTVLGETYPEGGEEQAEAILRKLARHPSTARHVARKLARHFVADDPPPSAVAALEQAFASSGGHLPTVHRALVALPEAWDPTPKKLCSPTEFVISALRSCDVVPEGKPIEGMLTMMGQPPLRAPSPAGWPDTAADWGGPDALMKRVTLSTRLAEQVSVRKRPEDWLADALGPLAREATSAAVKRAASGRQGLVLGLMSPEFQRR